ncbi:alpha/beta-hydrolase [Pseudovirgaria hyperparasitica]|uniref:Alpha/beta-hydrolase n=1 Tax=Pseudovirgaria hyperparasitica TaxID=470096 RepID=A0A6A6W8L7_9PEZI|nr:alpha/beta-hydrolase [Pseudovirgaria hyperparasitica]KAF2758374.1 alpha/beta-hydrolase [Pseudovirgaria hyperparasitica]
MVPVTCKLDLKPFKAHHSEQQLEDFKTLLRLTPIAPETHENTTRLDGHYGLSREWAIRMKDVWLNKYDWRKTEDHINSFNNYTTQIKGKDGKEYTTHFVAMFSDSPDAVPVALVHGWPGSFLEFLHYLNHVKSRYTSQDLPYHFIVPSMTGYAYSSGPSITTEWTTNDIAYVINELMTGLGFGSGYISHGGDIGSFVSRILAAKYDNCKAIHLNFCITGGEPKDVKNEEITPQEWEGMKRLADFGTYGNAYAKEHGTKGGTIGLILASNPLALLCWIGEKYIAWTDETPKDEDILDSVMLYWVTETFPRCIYPYIDFFGRGNESTVFHGHPDYYVKKPIGYSYFPFELGPVPLAWAKTTGNIVFHRAHKSGGHFAALEKPKELFEDQEEFIKGLNWSTLVSK